MTIFLGIETVWVALFMLMIWGFTESTISKFHIGLNDLVWWQYLIVSTVRALTTFAVILVMFCTINPALPFLVGFFTPFVFGWLLGFTRWGKKNGVKRPFINRMLIVDLVFIVLILVGAAIGSVLK